MADRWIAAAVAATAALAAGGVLLFHRPAAPSAGGTVAATGTARVIRADVTVRTLVGGTLGYQDPATVPAVVPGILTWAPAPGAVVGADHRLYEVDGLPVLLLAGARPAWREFAPDMPDGPDVAQLEADLVRSGFGAGLTVDDHFSAATATAVRRWQAAHGLPRTGAIPLGEVVFRSAPVRVAAVAAPLGASAADRSVRRPVADAASPG